jgi:hypothetical protein
MDAYAPGFWGSSRAGNRYVKGDYGLPFALLGWSMLRILFSKS